MSIVLLSLLPFSAVFLVLLASCLVARRKKCPDCGDPLPAFQSPASKTWRQWVEGGYQCRRCGCETTIAGGKVALGAAPSSGSVIKSAVMLGASLTGPLVLLYILFQR